MKKLQNLVARPEVLVPHISRQKGNRPISQFLEELNEALYINHLSLFLTSHSERRSFQNRILWKYFIIFRICEIFHRSSGVLQNNYKSQHGICDSQQFKPNTPLSSKSKLDLSLCSGVSQYCVCCVSKCTCQLQDFFNIILHTDIIFQTFG